MPVKAIARALGISRNTVRSAVAGDSPPKYVRRPAGSVVDGFEPWIRELLQAYPAMPATVIAERIGWDRGLTVLKDRVRELRPVYLPPDPASRTSYVAGEIAQCDLWFPPVELPVGFGQVRRPAQLPVLTMVTGYSRWLSAVLIPSRKAEDLFTGWWQLISSLGAVRARSAGGGAAGPSSPASARRSAAPWPPRWWSASPPIRRPRAWSSGCTTTWSGRSCRAGPSTARRTSTSSWAPGSRW